LLWYLIKFKQKTADWYDAVAIGTSLMVLCPEKARFERLLQQSAFAESFDGCVCLWMRVGEEMRVHERYRERRDGGGDCERNGEREGRTEMRVVREDEIEREKRVENGRDRETVRERKGRIAQEGWWEGGQKRREGGEGGQCICATVQGGGRIYLPSTFECAPNTSMHIYLTHAKSGL